MSDLVTAGGESPSPSQPTEQLRDLKVGMVVYDSVRPETVGSIYPLAQFATLDIVAGCYVDRGRNIIAERTKEPFLLFVDADMSFSGDHLMMLKDAMDLDPTIGAIAGIYVKRTGTFEPICHWAEEIDGELSWVSGREVYERTLKYMKEGAVVDVDSFGTGFMLIRTEAMKSIGKPYFATKYDEKTSQFWGEDVMFGKRLKENGWRTCIHFGAQVAHFGTVGFLPEHMEGIPLPDEESAEESCNAI